MKDTKIPFGLHTLTHTMKSIDEVEKGLACSCICPECKAPLVAKLKDDKQVRHFSHYRGGACGGGLETSVHLMAKQILEEYKQITTPRIARLPRVELNPGWLEGDEIIFDAYELNADRVSVEKHEGNIRPDIILHKGGRALRVEVAVTHFVDKEKHEKVKKKNVAMIEINLRSFYEDGLIDKAKFVNSILYSQDNKEWIHHPKLESAYKIAFTELEERRDLELLEKEKEARQKKAAARSHEMDMDKHETKMRELFQANFAAEIKELECFILKDQWIKTEKQLAAQNEGLLRNIKQNLSFSQFTPFKRPSDNIDMLFNVHPYVWQAETLYQLINFRKPHNLYSLAEFIRKNYGMPLWAWKLFKENKRYKDQGQKRDKKYQFYGMYFMGESFCKQIPSPYITIQRYLKFLQSAGLVRLGYNGSIDVFDGSLQDFNKKLEESEAHNRAVEALEDKNRKERESRGRETLKKLKELHNKTMLAEKDSEKAITKTLHIASLDAAAAKMTTKQQEEFLSNPAPALADMKEAIIRHREANQTKKY